MFFDEFDFPYGCPYRQYPSMPPPPPGAGGGQHGGGAAPQGPPPSHVPQKVQYGPKAIESGSIRPCKYQYVYLWLTNGTSFWAWLTYVGRKSVAGYRWQHHRWVYFGIDTRRIESFVCY